jgi:class 3 adenylate cyclase
MDSILEKMINRPILNGKKPRVSKYLPRIDNRELEICYNKIRRGHQDEGFVNTLSIFSLLLLATDLNAVISH